MNSHVPTCEPRRSRPRPPIRRKKRRSVDPNFIRPNRDDPPAHRNKSASALPSTPRVLIRPEGDVLLPIDHRSPEAPTRGNRIPVYLGPLGAATGPRVSGGTVPEARFEAFVGCESRGAVGLCAPW